MVMIFMIGLVENAHPYSTIHISTYTCTYVQFQSIWENASDAHVRLAFIASICWKDISNWSTRVSFVIQLGTNCLVANQLEHQLLLTC